MFQTLKNSWKVPELRNKLLFTLLIILIYRLGASIPVPYVNSEVLNYYSQYSGTVLDFMSLLSGGAMAQATLFALSVSPYITASIVMQLLTIAIPPLERMAKDEDGNFKVNGQNVLIPIMYKSTDNMMISMLEQLGAPYSTAEGDILAFNDTTTDLLLEIYEHAYTRAFSTFKISSYPANFLNRGQCIFAIDSTAGASWMGSDAPLIDIAEDRIVKFETAVMTVPQFDTENPTMISQGPSVCVFNKPDNGEVLASWLFAQYLLTNDVQIAYAQTEGYVPVTSKAQSSPEYLDYLSREGEDGEMYYDIKLKATKLTLD